MFETTSSSKVGRLFRAAVPRLAPPPPPPSPPPPRLLASEKRGRPGITWAFPLPPLSRFLFLAAALVALAASLLLSSSDPAAAQEPSSDAGLRDLYLHGYPFTQTFDPARTEYAATVGQNQTRVFVRARANHSEAAATIADERSTSSGWLIVSLDPRPSCIAVVVTAEDGTTTRTYAIGIDGQVPGSACTTPEPPPNQLSITPTKPWRWPFQTDDLSFTVGGLVDGDLADEVVTGTLSREPGNAEGSYAINMGTLAVTDAYAEKYGLPSAPTIDTYTIEPSPEYLSIRLTKPWKRLGEPDALSYELLGLADGDRAEDVVTGALAREPGEDLGSYAINMGTLALTDAYAPKYDLHHVGLARISNYFITDLPVIVNEADVGDAQGAVLFLEDQTWWDNDEYLPPGESAPLGDSLNVTPGMPVRYSVAPTTSPTADVMIEVKTDPPVDWIWGEYSSWTPQYLYYTGPFTFNKGDAPGWLSSKPVQIIPGPDASGTVTITHTGLSADPNYNGRLGTFTINVVPRQPGECSSLAAPTVAQGADHVVGIAAGPAECGSRLIVGYETEISENSGPWQPLHSYPREWRHNYGKVRYLSEKVLKPATLEFAGSPGVAYRVRSRGIADDADGLTSSSNYNVYGPAKTIATSWSPVTDFTIADRALSAGDTDYDIDDDGLIEVSSLAQLDAIRWDMNGGGSPDLLAFRSYYAAAFPDAVSGMGCPYGCKGYELTTDLDFDTNGNGQADAGDTYWNESPGSYGSGWTPLGERSTESAVAFAAVFDGNGHVIRNLYIDGYSAHMGLFSRVDNTGVIRDVGLESVDVTRRGHHSGKDVGGLVGLNEGIIKDCYVTGTVSGVGAVGGLAGGVNWSGVIKDSYATASVTGSHSADRYSASGVGGLVGVNSGKVMGSYATGEVSGEIVDAGGLVGVHWNGLIKASYATGDVSANGGGWSSEYYNPEYQSGGGLVGSYHGGDIEASYATGEVSGEAAHLGGLAGEHRRGIVTPGGVVSASYWNTDSSGLSTSAGGVGKTGAELVTPTDYAGIYAAWNVDLDSDGRADDPWDFGTNGQYPVLKHVGPGIVEQRAWLPTPPELATYSVSATATAVEGENATLTITLSEPAPTGGAAFTVTASYPTSGATADDLGSITSPVTVREGLSSLEIAVPTVDDNYDEEDETFTVAVATVSSDWTPAGVGQDTATVTIEDDDTAGVSVNAANPLAVAEGGSATYTVVLDSQPTGDVTVSASSNDAGAATVSPASHTFTPSGWNAPLTFTVSGVADDDTNDETVAVSHGVTSDDGKYGSVLLATVQVAISETTGSGLQQKEQTPQEKYADLIAQMYEWRNDPQWASYKAHTDRWDRALLAFGEEVADQSLTAMTAAEAQGYADQSWGERWVPVAKALKEIEATTQQDQQQVVPNQAPTVSNAIADATIVNESGTKGVLLSGTFSDTDNDALTITAGSDNEAVATVSVASDYSALTVSAKGQGTATITVTAADGNGGMVEDAFTVRVKAAPVVASAITDLTGLEEGATQDVSLSGMFSDADGDALTITAVSSDEAKATVTVAADHSSLTVKGVAEGTVTITVTAQDSDGNRVSDDFEVPVAKRYTALIAKMYEWRNDPQWVSERPHTDRWDRALLAFGETVADATLTPMTADEAQGFADRGWERWVEVAAALQEIEAAGQAQQQQGTPNQAPTVSSALADVTIVNASGTHQASLSGVFSDADNDALTITAGSDDEAVATVSVASDYSTLTVSAKGRGTATITVTAADGNGGTVEDAFTVGVKAAPVVALAITDVTGLEEGATQEVSLSGVFNDADGDALTITAASSDETKATVTVAADQSKLTVAGVAEGTATITVSAQDSDGNRVSDAFDVSVVAPPPQVTPNQAPTVSAAIGDAIIVHESGTNQVSLSGVFDDADGDNLTVDAASSDGAKATVSVATDYSSLTVTAQARGTANITVTADDGNGGTVSDAFTVTVKAAPVVSSAISDVSGLVAQDTQDVSLSGVFSDADGDALTITAVSSDEAKATVTVAADHSSLTVKGVAEGTVTITVTAQDSDGNRVSDAFDVAVEPEPEQDPPPDEETPNRPPTVAQPLPDISLERLQWRQFSLPDVFHDPDGDELTFTSVSSDYGVASTWVSGSTLTVVAKGTGTATITVTAEDPDGNQVSDEFEVTVTPAS